MVTFPSKTTLVPSDRRPPRTKENHENSWTVLGGQSPNNRRRSRIWLVVPGTRVNEFWARNSEWKELQQNLCLACLRKIKRSRGWMNVLNWTGSWILIRVFLGRSSPVMKSNATTTTRKYSMEYWMSQRLPKKCVMWSPMSRRCRFASLMRKKKIPQNLFLLVKLRFLFGIMAVETVLMLQTAYKNATLSKAQDILFRSSEAFIRHDVTKTSRPVSKWRVMVSYDNAPGRPTLSMRQWLTKYGMVPFTYPLYSSDFALCNLFICCSEWKKKSLN